MIRSRSLLRLAGWLGAAAGVLLLLPACSTSPLAGGGLGGYNPVAYRPHNPSAVRVKVSLNNQAVYVLEGGKPLLVAATCVGIPGKSTPTGSFRIYRKEASKRSGSYGFWVNGPNVAPGESGHKTVSGGHYIGYPMAYWCEFSPAYGFHEGYVWPRPRTHGCLRLHHNVAPKFFQLVRTGTPVNIAYSQPEDATIGANLSRPNDYNDPDPPAAYMVSSRVFSQANANLLSSY